MSKKPKFKIGDKVILFNLKDMTGEVIKIDKEFKGSYLVKWMDGYEGSYKPSELTKIVDALPKPKIPYGKLMR